LSNFYQMTLDILANLFHLAIPFDKGSKLFQTSLEITFKENVLFYTPTLDVVYETHQPVYLLAYNKAKLRDRTKCHAKRGWLSYIS